MAAKGIHQRAILCFLARAFLDGKRAAPPTDDECGDSHGDHGHGNPRGLAQNRVVQRKQRVGVPRKQPVVLKVVAGVLGRLPDVDPVPFQRSGEPVDRGER